MLVAYKKYLYPDEVEALEANGWVVGRPGCDPAKFPGNVRPLLQEKYIIGNSVALLAAKEFDSPATAMFEVEELLDVDVIADKGPDGVHYHEFWWQEGKDWSRFAMGWDCAKHMYDAPETPRDAAVLLQEARKATQRRKK